MNPQRKPYHRICGSLGIAFVLASLLCPGFGIGRAQTRALTGAPVATNRVAVIDPAQLVAMTNQFSATQQAQAELIQKLLTRIDQLERKDAEREATAQALQKAHDDAVKARETQTEKLATQVTGLEARVASLQSGRVLPEIAVAPDDSPTTRELDQKLRIMERKNELAAETAEARAKEQPRLTVGSGGFALSSADTNFVIKFRGVVQVDSRTFLGDNSLLTGNDGFILRRARPIIEGTVFRDFDFQFVPDFGGSSVQIFDANLNYRYRKELQLRAGKFKGPVSLENQLADAALPFNERGLVSNFMPVRDLGVSLWGDVNDGLLSYALGVYNVTGDARNAATSDFGDDKQFAGRLFLRPLKESGIVGLEGLGFGIGASYSQVNSNANGLPNTSGGTRPGYITPGAQQFFAYQPVNGTVVADGVQGRLSPQLSYLWGPFGLFSEYAITHQSVENSATRRKAGLDHTAWQLSAQWVLTGEAASFNGIVPLHPFQPGSGGWGAWQLVGRFGGLDIDDKTFPNFSNPATSASSAFSWSAGLNWWLNRNVRVMTSFSHTAFQGGGIVKPGDTSTTVPPATVTAQDENAVFTRLQLSF